MKSKILIIGIILLIIAFAGCIENNKEVKNNNSNLSNNQTTFVPTTITTTEPGNTTTVHYEASGFCPYVVDGDTIDVEGVGRIRFVGVNTPERGQPGYQEAKDFVKSLCLYKTVYLDIDDAKHYDKYGRVLAVVYADNINVNAELLKRGYAEIMYIPPSEFNPYLWT
jgi:micrococcal nuclease